MEFDKMSVASSDEHEPQPSCSWQNVPKNPQPSCSWQSSNNVPTSSQPSCSSYNNNVSIKLRPFSESIDDDSTVVADDAENSLPTHSPDWQSNYDSISARNGLLINNSLWSDMEIHFPNENITIPAHRVIIAPASNVLSNMIEANIDNKIIEIIDTEYKTFMEVLRYIYTDFLEITIDNAISIIAAAKKYQLKYLEQKCINVIATEINIGNVCKYFNQLVNDNVVIERCLKLIKAQTREIIIQKSFLDLSVDKLLEFLQIDGLNVSERELYESILLWADNACRLAGILPTSQNKRKSLNKCEFQIRFPTMDAQTFMECVQLDPLFLTKDEIGELNVTIMIGKNDSQFSDEIRNSFNITKNKATDHVSRDVSTIGSDIFFKNESDGFEIKPNCSILLKGFGIYGLLVEKPEVMTVTLTYTVFEPKAEREHMQEKKILCDGTSKIYSFMLETPIEYTNCVYNTFIFEFDIGGKYYCNNSNTSLKDEYNVLSTKKYNDFSYYRIKEVYFDTI